MSFYVIPAWIPVYTLLAAIMLFSYFLVNMLDAGDSREVHLTSVGAVTSVIFILLVIGILYSPRLETDTQAELYVRIVQEDVDRKD